MQLLLGDIWEKCRDSLNFDFQAVSLCVCLGFSCLVGFIDAVTVHTGTGVTAQKHSNDLRQSKGNCSLTSDHPRASALTSAEQPLASRLCAPEIRPRKGLIPTSRA